MDFALFNPNQATAQPLQAGAVACAWWQDVDKKGAPVFQNSALDPRNARADFNPVREQLASEVQLSLFDRVGEDNYAFIETFLKRLPRQRQREHFRQLYLNELDRNHGKIRYANEWLRETLGERLKKVFKLHRVNVSHLHAFNSDPNWAQEVALEINIESRQITVPTWDEWQNRGISPELRKAADNHAQREIQKSELPFYLINETELKTLAYKLSVSFSMFQMDATLKTAEQDRDEPFTEKELRDFTQALYEQCGKICELIGFPIDHWQKFLKYQAKGGKNKLKGEAVDIALNHLVCAKYWLRKMRKIQNQMVEHIAIACGEVRKGVSSYASRHAQNVYKQRVKKSYEFLDQMIIENIDDPEEQISLLEMYKRSTSYPAIRRAEMMNRLRGLEEYAEREGHSALFLTLTAPASYHATTHSGRQNKRWHGNTPSQAQAYLNNLWAEIRAIFLKRKIETYYGMRVAEPHHDATPHWHFLMYINPENRDEIIRIFRAKALEEDGDEQGAQKHRFKVDDILPDKGSATAYIAKYVAKNIDGFSPDEAEKSDEDPTMSLRDNALAAKTWASLWNIRQFQFFGTPPITDYRELRRLGDKPQEDELIDTVRAVCDVACFATYIDLQGGANAKRTEQPLRIFYQDSEPNAYGAIRRITKGVENQRNGKQVMTRLKKYIIKRKPNSDLTALSEESTPNLERSDTKTSARSAPRTCVSNCNPENRLILEQNIREFIKPIRTPLNHWQIDHLIREKRLILNQRQRVEIRGNAPILVETEIEPPILQKATSAVVRNLRNLFRK